MAKPLTKQSETHSWAVYHIKGTPAKLVDRYRLRHRPRERAAK
jgi:hypothetical protein